LVKMSALLHYLIDTNIHSGMLKDYEK